MIIRARSRAAVVPPNSFDLTYFSHDNVFRLYNTGIVIRMNVARIFFTFIKKESR